MFGFSKHQKRAYPGAYLYRILDGDGGNVKVQQLVHSYDFEYWGNVFDGTREEARRWIATRHIEEYMRLQQRNHAEATAEYY